MKAAASFFQWVCFFFSSIRSDIFQTQLDDITEQRIWCHFLCVHVCLCVWTGKERNSSVATFTYVNIVLKPRFLFPLWVFCVIVDTLQFSNYIIPLYWYITAEVKIGLRLDSLSTGCWTAGRRWLIGQAVAFLLIQGLPYYDTYCCLLGHPGESGLDLLCCFTHVTCIQSDLGHMTRGRHVTEWYLSSPSRSAISLCSSSFSARQHVQLSLFILL